MVEAALSIPLTTFLMLGIIELGMMHQAHIMTQVAAYRAVRAGIVNSGDCNSMKRAAFTALVPTFGPTPRVAGVRSIPGRADTPGSAALVYTTYRAADAALKAALGFELVKVEVLNPKRRDISRVFGTYGAHLNNQEIDFDDVRDQTVRDANLLSVRVKYWYRLRIPFANWTIHTTWLGQEILRAFKGVQFEVQTVGGVAERYAAQANAVSKGGDRQLAAAVAAGLKLYYIPLHGTYTMRMQSNLMRRWVEPCAVDN